MIEIGNIEKRTKRMARNTVLKVDLKENTGN